MKIANIITKNKIKVSDEINVVDSIDKIIDGIPTLIVGIDLTETIFPDFDVLNFEIEKNFYWTVKSTEKRDKYEEDLRLFLNKAVEIITEDVTYIFIDLIQFKKKKIRKIVTKILSLKKIVTYQKDTMLYLYGENIIFGIDLGLIAYFGGNIIKVKEKIKNKSYVFLNDDDILIYEKTIKELGNNIRFTPFIYSIINEKTTPTSNIHIQK